MIAFIEYLGVPLTVGIVLVGALLVMQFIGEFLDFKGKVVPEFMNIRKSRARKKEEKKETAQTLKDVKQLLGEVNAHYSDDNITKRNDWMKWVNDRAVVYDESIVGINESLAQVTAALKGNTELSEEMFVQSSRDRIIDFATKAANMDTPVSREEYNRIFKTHDRYESFLKERGMTNGEVDISMRIIRESYEERTKGRLFVEDVRGYN